MPSFSLRSPSVLPKFSLVYSLMAQFAVSAFGGESTPASAIQVHDGFSVERLYSVKIDQRSWVAMCFDDKGRIYASSQYRFLVRLTPPAIGAPSGAETKVEIISRVWGNSQGMTFLNGALYSVEHGNHGEQNFLPDRIVRFTDSNGDDILDREETIFEFPAKPGDQAAWNEHGVHAIVPGPDGRSFYVVGGDREGLPSEKGRAPHHWNQDVWGQKWNADSYAGGWVLRLDLDGKNPETICVGLRNPYDIAFNHTGDLFTFDSDLEFTVGLPDYRPIAIRQILSGTESGWGGHGGSMSKSLVPKWEDVQPPLKNIGQGSPTGVTFGYGAKFPRKYQEAFFACDWSYGRMFAVHLTPKGATYQADVEPFLTAQGLPIADVAVSPKDGAMYFVVGGRGTQSGLYRVTYQGAESTEPAPVKMLDAESARLRNLRLELESFHGYSDPKALAILWPQLGHVDRAIRGAARVALEWQPVPEWKERALKEANPRLALQALLALSRSTDGDVAVQASIVEALERVDFPQLSSDEQSWFLRILALSSVRHGPFSKEVSARLLAKLEANLPTKVRRVNEDLAELCAALGSRTFLPKALDLLEHTPIQEEQVVYTGALLKAEAAAWTPELRERLLRSVVARVPSWKGGSSVKRARETTLASCLRLLSEAEKQQFAELIASANRPPVTFETTARGFVKAWKMEDFTDVLASGMEKQRNLENGRALYSAAGCVICHSFQGEGGLGGPDLTSAGGRYSSADLLDNILNPSKVINEQFTLSTFSFKDGTQVTGRVINMVGDTYIVALNLMDIADEKRFFKKDVVSTEVSPISFMPEGLLNTLSEEDVLDLLAYLRSRETGDAQP